MNFLMALKKLKKYRFYYIFRKNIIYHLHMDLLLMGVFTLIWAMIFIYAILDLPDQHKWCCIFAFLIFVLPSPFLIDSIKYVYTPHIRTIIALAELSDPKLNDINNAYICQKNSYKKYGSLLLTEDALIDAKIFTHYSNINSLELWSGENLNSLRRNVHTISSGKNASFTHYLIATTQDKNQWVIEFSKNYSLDEISIIVKEIMSRCNPNTKLKGHHTTQY